MINHQPLSPHIQVTNFRMLLIPLADGKVAAKTVHFHGCLSKFMYLGLCTDDYECTSAMTAFSSGGGLPE